jgi:Zn-dependent metalloprotease
MTHLHVRLTLLAALAATTLLAQTPQKHRPSASAPKPTAEQKKINAPQRPAVPMAAPLLEGTPNYAPKSAFVAPAQRLRTQRDAQGRVIFWSGLTAASAPQQAESRSVGERALDYLTSVAPDGVRLPSAEFMTRQVSADEQGQQHVRMTQMWQGVPVYGAELVAHTNASGAFDRLNGRYYPTPSLSSATPALDATQAISLVKNQLGDVKETWSDMERAIIGGGAPFEATLVVYHVDNQTDNEHLAWHVTGHPNLMRRVVYFVDATSGSVLNHYDHTCNLVGHRHQHADESAAEVPTEAPTTTGTAANGPVTASGNDLLGINRSFGAWQVGSQVLLEDASQSMFNSAQSQMPNDPVGAIITLDALSTSPEVQQSFDFDFVKSSSTTFNNPRGVSGHWNSIKSYQYFKNKFNRNSIDGAGGNIIAFVNVAESNGSSMENAFWNGAAMWYGNGGSTFRPLARGLDVGGHEMTHGVIEKTANLEYQGESGALNESFADIFAVMIDLGDWQIGEDVMQPGTHTCLRDMANPNNGVSQNSPWWQPDHTDDQYTGSQDNGGVHINSGITNRAFYLFATASGVGTDKAEQVYYKALRDYLVKSSQFVDCRIAVIQAATDLYGSSVANAAASAFDQVGILGDAPAGNYLGQLSANPGEDFILCTSDDLLNLDLAIANGQVLGSIYENGVYSRPSVTDNGRQAVFVNDNRDIMYIDFEYTPTEINPTVNVLSNSPIWRNAAISKDGRFLAALSETEEPSIVIVDLLDPTNSVELQLYNPTYTQGQVTGEVRYADVLEFDYSGQYLMYDAYNEIISNQGQDLSYWDIGFVEFWKNNDFVNGDNAFISKLFNGLPEGTSVANPTFAKNSPFVIAFDFNDELNDEFGVLGANVETGEYDALVSNLSDYAWPNHDRLDQSIVYHVIGNTSNNIRRQGLASDKISPNGSSSAFISNHVLGVWYANGSRSLSVSTQQPDAHAALALRVQPNPTSGALQVQFSVSESTSVVLEVVDLLGRTVQQHRTQATEGRNVADLDLGQLPTGSYVVRVLAGNTVASQLVVLR